MKIEEGERENYQQQLPRKLEEIPCKPKAHEVYIYIVGDNLWAKQMPFLFWAQMLGYMQLYYTN